MIRVYSKKAYVFTNPKNKNESCTVGKEEFASLPNYAEKDQLFQWAKADGAIEIVNKTNDKAEEPVIDINPEDIKPVEETVEETTEEATEEATTTENKAKKKK